MVILDFACNFNEMCCITVQTPLEILWDVPFCLIWWESASNCSNFAMKNFQQILRTCYIDAKMSYESIARNERVSKSTQTEIFRFSENFLQNKKDKYSLPGILDHASYSYSHVRSKIWPGIECACFYHLFLSLTMIFLLRKKYICPKKMLAILYVYHHNMYNSST